MQIKQLCKQINEIMQANYEDIKVIIHKIIIGVPAAAADVLYDWYVCC